MGSKWVYGSAASWMFVCELFVSAKTKDSNKNIAPVKKRSFLWPRRTLSRTTRVNRWPAPCFITENNLRIPNPKEEVNLSFPPLYPTSLGRGVNLMIEVNSYNRQIFETSRRLQKILLFNENQGSGFQYFPVMRKVELSLHSVLPTCTFCVHFYALGKKG